MAYTILNGLYRCKYRKVFEIKNPDCSGFDLFFEF